MSRFRYGAASAGGFLLGLVLCAPSVLAQSTGYAWTYGFGAAATTEELAVFSGLSAQPDGRGLPEGKGGYEQGQKVYAQACAACHGDKLEGIPKPGIGGDKLIGARGSLASEAPVKTVESFWPYASTLVDYIKRAMPFNAPGSLSNDDVYAVTAYILGEANIVAKTTVLDRASVAKIEMPNRNGFVPDPRPEIELYR
jgi:S-disulfanyl-L-cysteine oxidoreductase SoxD